MMLSFIIPFIALYGGLEANSNMFVSRPSPTFSAEIVCKIFPDFTPEQRNFCMKHPRVASAIAIGIQNGLQECENQFEHDRWNCKSTHPETQSFGQTRAIKGTKEAAFLNAIVSAGVAHSVTAACARNNITGCVCAGNKGQINTKASWKKGGCTNNIAHGIDISKTFLDGSRGQIWEKYELQIRHNREAGREAVRKIVDFRCNCHGVSGACTSKTCWEILSSSFERVGHFLKKKYSTEAMLVVAEVLNSREGKIPKVLVVPGTKFAKVSIEHLVYLDKSPTYCDPIPVKGVAGTKGRVCDQHPNGTCDYLCCGRGRVKVVSHIKTQCQCQFYWCCEVKCKTCKIMQEKTICT